MIFNVYIVYLLVNYNNLELCVTDAATQICKLAVWYRIPWWWLHCRCYPWQPRCSCWIWYCTLHFKTLLSSFQLDMLLTVIMFGLLGILVAHYLQSLTPSLVLGGELVYHRRPGEEGTVTSLVGRYTGKDFEVFIKICRITLSSHLCT